MLGSGDKTMFNLWHFSANFWSRFSKHEMTSSSIFLVNVPNWKIPGKRNYHMKPNARLEIYKAFQDHFTFLNLHMIVWFSWISLTFEIYGEYRDCRSFRVFNTFTSSQAGKSFNCYKIWFVFWAQWNQTLFFRSIEYFRIPWLFLIDIW